MELRFVLSESTFDYFDATGSYLERHGKPVAFVGSCFGRFRQIAPQGFFEAASFASSR